MLLRELTEKQEKFAAARARGKSWADAYREAYEPSNPNAPSIYTRAHRTRQNPLVAQRILELREQLKPAADVSAVYQQLLTAALKLAETATDDKTRLGALQLAARELERSGKLEEEARRPVEAKKTAEESAGLIAELRSLYARTLPKKAPAVESAEEEPGETPAEEESEEIVEETGERMPGEVEAPEPRYRMVDVPISPPGHFPVRYARRLVSY